MGSDLSEAVLVITSGYQRRSAYDGPPERTHVIDTALAYVSATHDTIPVVIVSAVSSDRSSRTVRSAIERPIGAVTLGTANVIDESVRVHSVS